MALDYHLTKVVVALCDALDTPLSLSVKRMVKEERWNDLVATKVHPSSYANAIDYHKDVIAVDFLRKADFLPTGIDLHAQAVQTFWQSERQCHETNRKLSQFIGWFEDGFIGDDIDLTTYEIINTARESVRSHIGSLPKDLTPKLGKGATFHDRGELVTIPDKFSSQPTRTSRLWWGDLFTYHTAWGLAVLNDYPSRSAPLLVRGNRFTSVPKDSGKNRGICVEPGINLALQLPVGAVLKRRLLDAGIDLKNGQGKHRNLARFASIWGSHATIDLSNASDTICKNLVKLLLPSAWHDLLMDLRSPMTYVDGKWVSLEKFSSMGNGFTFELETLIFLSIASAAISSQGGNANDLIKSGDLCVYGDDIIVPTEYGHRVVELLRFFGFTPNGGKTFLSGPFRESCGGDFFLGQAVRPHHLKEDPHEPHQWIALANGLRRLGISDNSDDAWRFGLLHPWLKCLDAIPVDVRRLRGPRALGDLVIHDSPQRWSTKTCWSHSWVRTWTPVSQRVSWKGFSPSVHLAAALYGVPSSGATPRKRVSSTEGHHKRWMPLLEATEF